MEFVSGKLPEEVTVKNRCWLLSNFVKSGMSIRESGTVYKISESTVLFCIKSASHQLQLPYLIFYGPLKTTFNREFDLHV